MSIFTPIKERKSKVHFSQYIVTGLSRADEPKPAEASAEPAKDIKPEEIAKS